MGVEGLSGGRWTAKSIRSAPQPKPQAGRRCWCVRPKRYGDPCQRSIPSTHKARPWRPGYAARSIPLVFSRPAVSWGRRMQTNFAPEQLADPAMRTSEAVIRKCVHCGFCTATCPTYVLLGDELDRPRGRIYLMKDMLENEREPNDEIVKPIDRRLSLLSCMQTRPPGGHHLHPVNTT